MSLRDHYQRGALRALVDAGMVKRAVLGEIMSNAPAVARAFVSTKAKARARGALRDAAGLETPEWREAGGLFEIPELAAQRATEQLSAAWDRSPPAASTPEEAALPVVKIDLPPEILKKESRARASSLP